MIILHFIYHSGITSKCMLILMHNHKVVTVNEQVHRMASPAEGLHSLGIF